MFECDFGRTVNFDNEGVRCVLKAFSMQERKGYRSSAHASDALEQTRLGVTARGALEEGATEGEGDGEGHRS
eukprot:8379265-Pyramimonas_sp.AAC.1